MLIETRTQGVVLGCLVAGVLACEASDTPGRDGRPSPGLPDFDASEVAEGMFPFPDDLPAEGLAVGERRRLPCEAGGTMTAEGMERREGLPLQAAITWERCGFLVGDSVWMVRSGDVLVTAHLLANELTIRGMVRFEGGGSCEVDLRGGIAERGAAAGTICGRYGMIRGE